MTMDEFVNEFKKQLEKKNVVVFTGAGMSTASGIKDFRGKNGLYKENINAEEILSKPYFDANPEEFYNFYRHNLLLDESIKPNLAHELIKDLEDEGYIKAVITQNIDGLDLMAGTKNVIEIHGNANKFYCTKCHKEYSLEDIKGTEGVPICSDCGSIIRPDIVLYCEQLDMFKLMNSQDAVKYATTLLVMGSSLKVNPAASLVHDFLVETRFNKDKKLFILNMGPTDYDGFKDIYRCDGDVVDFARKMKK